MKTNDAKARLSFRTSERINKALQMYGKVKRRSVNYLVNEAVYFYLANQILHCSVQQLRDESIPIDELFQCKNEAEWR